MWSFDMVHAKDTLAMEILRLLAISSTRLAIIEVASDFES